MDRHFLQQVAHWLCPVASGCTIECPLHSLNISWTIQARENINIFFLLKFVKQSTHVQMELTLTLPIAEKENTVKKVILEVENKNNL